MNRSTIPWTQYTWNVTTGCAKVSRGCANCYAERVSASLQNRGVADYQDTVYSHAYAQTRWTGHINLLPHRLVEPLKMKEPALIFIDSMSDLFHDQVPDDFIDQVIAVIALTPRHTYQILTKRVERMKSYFDIFATLNDPIFRNNRLLSAGQRIYDEHLAKSKCHLDLKSLDVWPLPNLWLGCSIEDQATADFRLPLLQLISAHRRFVSIEPLIGPIDLGYAYPCGYYCDSNIGHVDHPFWSWGTDTQLNWLIMGAESGSQSRPFEPTWLETIIQQAHQAGVSLFIKQLGSHWASRSGNSRVDPRGEDVSLWPLIWRFQQYPPDLQRFFGPPIEPIAPAPAQMQFEIKGE